jgi:hypothetical protein
MQHYQKRCPIFFRDVAAFLLHIKIYIHIGEQLRLKEGIRFKLRNYYSYNKREDWNEDSNRMRNLCSNDYKSL